MTVFLLLILFLVDFLYIGLLSFVFTRNRAKNNFEYSFRCAGSFTFNSKGRMTYFSGSLSLIGLSNDEIVLGITKLSYHKKYCGIEKVRVSRSLLWKCITIETKSGETVKIYCDSKQAKEVEGILS